MIVYATCAYEKSVSRVLREYSTITSMMHAHLVLRGYSYFLSLRIYVSIERDRCHLAQDTGGHRHFFTYTSP